MLCDFCRCLCSHDSVALIILERRGISGVTIEKGQFNVGCLYKIIQHFLILTKIKLALMKFVTIDMPFAGCDAVKYLCYRLSHVCKPCQCFLAHSTLNRVCRYQNQNYRTAQKRKNCHQKYLNQNSTICLLLLHNIPHLS